LRGHSIRPVVCALPGAAQHKQITTAEQAAKALSQPVLIPVKLRIPTHSSAKSTPLTTNYALVLCIKRYARLARLENRGNRYSTAQVPRQLGLDD
jgi:hypothetical protein